MNESTTNPLTGLPTLPEGYIWRIGQNSRRRFYDIFDTTPPGAYIQVVQVAEVKKEEKQRLHILGIPLWKTTVFITEHLEEVVVHFPIVTTETYDSPVFNDDDEETGVKVVERDTHVDGDDLTKELILEFADKALLRFQDVIRARGYLGDYPPKHIDKPETENAVQRGVVFRKGNR